MYNSVAHAEKQMNLGFTIFNQNYLSGDVVAYAFTKAIQLSLPSPPDNLGLENANVITVMLQVMEVAQKGGFSSKGSNQVHISRSPITSPCFHQTFPMHITPC